ncbi:MAG: caspase family protein [Pseudomonadota bacterium]
MTTKTIRILGIHGLGDQRLTGWETHWENAVTKTLTGIDDLKLEFDFVNYDDIFDETEISFAETTTAAWKLTQSGFTSIFRRRRGVIGRVNNSIRWSAGYVVAWVEDDGFKKKSRKRVLDKVSDFEPNVILAHSLGSLVSYNAFSHQDAADPSVSPLLKKVDYVSLGSQLGNAFVVRNLTNGRLDGLNVLYWHHLFNKADSVFTAPIRLPGIQNFQQVETFFDVAGIADHSATSYISHDNTFSNVWLPIVNRAKATRTRTKALKPFIERRKSTKKPRRALLVGINEYPNEQDRLEGCVNDVYLMSSVLQERGFAPEDIRVCVDRRATTEGILERMEWLFDECGPGDERVFYFSGHGAQIPEYGEEFEPDRHLECLVPWDFDWSHERSISDDQIYGLYSQLPYDARTLFIFDCCHSGGMHRSGSAKAKGLTPPDDVVHRELKWDKNREMWIPRDFQEMDKGFSRSSKDRAAYFGRNGSTARLGRATMLRALKSAEYEKLKSSSKSEIIGPYLPLILEACQEDQFAYEYRHGVISYGAFTYSLATILRRDKQLSFSDLLKKTGDQLKELDYAQEPAILGPSAIVNSQVPWN